MGQTHHGTGPPSVSKRQGKALAALSVRCAGGNVDKARLLLEQWLLIEWPADQAEPEKYYLSILPPTSALNDLVGAAHTRTRAGASSAITRT